MYMYINYIYYVVYKLVHVNILIIQVEFSSCYFVLLNPESSKEIEGFLSIKIPL